MHNSLPLVIFDGNCQGQHLASILTAAEIADCYAIGQDLGFVPSHLGEACRYLDEPTAIEKIRNAKDQGRIAIQGSQSTPTSDQLDLSYSGMVDMVIRYPHMQFYSVSPDESRARFGPRATPRRVFEMDMSVIEICQKRSGTSVDFSGWIRKNAPSTSLFHTALHPGGELTGMAVRSFASQIPGCDVFAIDQVESFFRSREGINSTSYHPIATSVLQDLGFDWGDDYQLYTRMMAQRAQGSWSELIAAEALYREKFRHDTWCWLSLTQAYTAVESRSNAETCLEQLLTLSPGNLHSWLIGFELYQRFDDTRGIYGLMHRAACFFKGQRTYFQVMAFFMLNMGNAELAAPYAREYHARTPDKADALVPLMLTLMHLGRPDDIREIMSYEVANASDARMSEIRAVLESIPDLNVYLPTSQHA